MKNQKIFKIIVIFIQTAVIIFSGIRIGYSDNNCLSPDTFQNKLSLYAKRNGGPGLEEAYEEWRGQIGEEELNGWLSLGLVGAFFRDYVSSLPKKEKKKYCRQYDKFIADLEGFGRVLNEKTEGGNKIQPIRLDTVISLQRSDVSYGVNELIANGIDAVLKERGLLNYLIGQFGEGFFLILKELEESQDPNDRITVTSSTDGKKAIRAEFRRVGKDYYIKFGIISNGVKKGTHIRVRRSDFSEKILVDGVYITRQELRNKKIQDAFSYSLSIPLMLNGRGEPVNSLDNFKGMGEIFGNIPRYLAADDHIKINTYKDGYEVTDNGIGIDRTTFFERLLVPRSSSYDEEMRKKRKEYNEKDSKEQMRLFYLKPKDANKIIEMDVLLQVSGVCIERFKVKGVNMPERVVIELPRWTSVGGEGRNKIVMDELAVKSFKYLIEQVALLADGGERDLLINGLAGIVREKQRVDKEVGRVKPADDLSGFIFNKVKDSNIDFKHKMVLPNRGEFLSFSAPGGHTKRYLDEDVFRFEPRNTPEIEPVENYEASPRYLFLADLNNDEQIYEEWGGYIFIDKKRWREAEEKDRQQEKQGKQPERLENLIRQLEHNMSFHIGYGPEPERVHFEKKIKEKIPKVKEPEKREVFDCEYEAGILLSGYEDTQIGKLKLRIVKELEIAKDKKKRLAEVKVFLDNLTDFLKLVEPYLENIRWPDLLFEDKRGALGMDDFRLFKDFRSRKAELEKLIRVINDYIGFEFNNGRNLAARKNLILNITKLNLWHFDLKKISIFLPFMKGKVLLLLTPELLDEWHKAFKEESLETIRQFSMFFNIIAPALKDSNELTKYSQRWHKIFSRYRRHSAILMELLGKVYPYKGKLPPLISEKGKRVEQVPDWENAKIGEPMKAHDDKIMGLDATQDGMYIVTACWDGTAKVWERGDDDKYKEFQTLKGHTGGVVSAQFSQDGKYIVTASRDETAKVWKMETGDCIQTLTGHTESVISAQFSPDGNYIVTASWDETAKVWETATGKCIKTLKGHTDSVYSAQFSPDGRYIVTASRDNTAKIWEAATGRCVQILTGHTYFVHSAQFSQDGNYIVTASNDKTAKVWEVATGRCIKTLMGHTSWVGSAQFSQDGKYIVTASGDETAMVWDVSIGKEINTINIEGSGYCALFTSDDRKIVLVSNKEIGGKYIRYLQVIEAGVKEKAEPVQTETEPDWEKAKAGKPKKVHDDRVNGLDVTKDGKYIVTASMDNTAKIWDRVSGKCIKTLKGHESGLFSAKFSQDGRYIVTASKDKTAKVWERATGRCIQTLKGHTILVWSAQFSSDGKYIVTASWDGTARVWETDTGRCIKILEGYGDQIFSAQFSQDGRYIVTASSGNTARVWDSRTGACIKTLTGHTGTVHSARFSQDGRYIVTASRDNTARVWEWETGECIKTLKGHKDAVVSAQFSPDGNYIVTASDDKTVRVWDVCTGEEVKSIQSAYTGYCVLFTSSGREIAVALNKPEGQKVIGYLQIITAGVKEKAEPVQKETEPDWEKAEVKPKIKAHDAVVNDFDATKDGKYIVTASADGTAKIWETATGECIKILKGHKSVVNSAQFSPDGDYIVTASADKTARIWDRASGKCVQKLTGHEGKVHSAQFSQDGNYIVTASNDETAKVWVKGKDGKYKEFQTLTGHTDIVTSAQFSSDGEYIVTTSWDCTAKVWKRGTHGKYTELQTLKGHKKWVLSAQFSPDDNYIVTASSDNTAIVWVKGEDSKYKKFRTLKGHTDCVNSAQFSPDVNYIVTASNDETAKVWVKEGNEYKLLQTLKGHTRWVSSAQFSSDGNYIVTASNDETAKVWDVSTGKEVKSIQLAGKGKCALFTSSGNEIVAISNEVKGWRVIGYLQVITAGVKQKSKLGKISHIPGWRFLQEGVSEEQAPFDLKKYLRYLKPEHAEFLVEREVKDFETGKEEYNIKNVELAKLILIARVMRDKVYRDDLSLEALDELLKQANIKNADLSSKRDEIEKVILGQEDSFCLFLRELIQNSRDAITGEKGEKDIDFTGFLGQGFYTAFSDFDEVRVKTSIGDGNIYYLTFVKDVDKSTGRSIIKLSNIERRRQDVPISKEEKKRMKGCIDAQSYIPKGKKEWIVSVTDPIGMDLFTIINYLLAPDASLKKIKRTEKRKNKYWRGTEIQRVKYFTGEEDEPQLDALIASEYLSLYAGAISAKDAVIYYNRFPEEEKAGELVNEEKEKLSTVRMKEGELNYYWCKKRRYNRITHKDLYFNDPGDHRAPDYTEFIPDILLDELYSKGLAIDIPKGMRLIRTRNALADEQKHLLPLKKAIAIGAMKASIYLMLKHDIYIPTLPQDFYDSLTQPFEERLREENVELAEKINEGKWDEIPADIFIYLCNPDNFGDLIQVMRNIKAEWTDKKGKIRKMSLEEQRRKILDEAESGGSFDSADFEGVSAGIIARMEEGFETAKSIVNAAPIYYEYKDEEIKNSPILSSWRRLLGLLAEAMDSPQMENRFIYSGKPDFGEQIDKGMNWNVRAFYDNGWIDKLIKLIDGASDVDNDFVYGFIIWMVEETASHEFRHVYEHLERQNSFFKARDTHQAEKGVKGAFGYEQKKLLKKIIKNRFNVPGVIRQLREEFSPENRKRRFGRKTWDTEKIITLAGVSNGAFLAAQKGPDYGEGKSSVNAEETGKPPACVKKLLEKAVDDAVPCADGIENFIKISGLKKFKKLFTKDLGKEDFPPGYPLSIREPEKREYPKDYINVNLPDTNTFLVSKINSGRYGAVRFGWLNDGTPVAIKGIYRKSKEDSNERILKEYKKACQVDELGICPRIHGLYLDKEFGRINIVMDIVPGDFRKGVKNFINSDTVRDLIEIYKRLTDNGLSINYDFQYFISKEGRVLIIDMGGIIQKSEKQSRKPVDIIGWLLFDISQDIKIKILEMIIREEPNLFKAIKERGYPYLINDVNEVEERLKKDGGTGKAGGKEPNACTVGEERLDSSQIDVSA